MTEENVTTREQVARLKADIKAITDTICGLKKQKRDCLDSKAFKEANWLHLERVLEERPKARWLLLAYAYLRGKTYRSQEPATTRKGLVYGGIEHCLKSWEGYPRRDGDKFLWQKIETWVKAGDKSRFELEDAKEKAA